MRFAAIADIHGNCLALDAVLADIAAHHIDTVVILGDHLSGPLEARRTAEVLMARDDVAIRGNHDRWLLEHVPEEMGISDFAAYRQLDESHRNWLAQLPATAIHGDIFLCHGTPASDTRYWLETIAGDGTVHMADRVAIEREAEGVEQSLILCAHTHLPRAVRLADARSIVNPGSVGCPGYTDDHPVPHKIEAGTPDAAYAILEQTDGRWQTTFRQVPYDNTAAARIAQDAGRADWASALATGWIA